DDAGEERQDQGEAAEDERADHDAVESAPLGQELAGIAAEPAEVAGALLLAGIRRWRGLERDPREGLGELREGDAPEAHPPGAEREGNVADADRRVEDPDLAPVGAVVDDEVVELPVEDASAREERELIDVDLHAAADEAEAGAGLEEVPGGDAVAGEAELGAD